MKLFVFAACAALLAAPAFAANRVVTFVNNTDFVADAIYGSNVGETSWEEDILDTDVLGSGESVDINFDDGSGYCKFDFKVTFTDGDEVVMEDVNVCEVSEVHIN